MINLIIKHRIFLILTAIVLLAGIIRFYKIDKFPVSLYWDEVSIAVNANFISETGKDEHGQKFPLIFKAFNDYKSPGNIYLTVIPVKIFGLNEFSARFVSAFLGTLLVLVMYFLGKNLAQLSKKNINQEAFGLLSAFLLAITPWHIHFSRSGFEANSGLFFVTLAVTQFIIFIKRQNFKFFYFASFFFAISCYFYRSDLIFAPLFFIFLLIINYKLLLTKINIPKTLIGILIFFFVLLPLVPPMISQEGMSRGNSVSIFNPDNSFNQVVESSRKYENSNKNPISKIIYNRRIAYANLFLENYISYFKFNFLFKSGDSIERHNVIGMGQFYLWQLPFFLFGLTAAIVVRKKITGIILVWLFLAAIPAALSVPAAHTLRSLNMLPAYIIIISAGLFIFYYLIPRKSYLLVTLIMTIIIAVSFFQYVSLYKKSAVLYSSFWGDGYKQLYNYTELNKDKYGKIVVSGHYWQPYAYALFYSGYDPKFYLLDGSRNGFDKYEFGGTIWEKEEELNYRKLKKYSKDSNTLFALSPKEHAVFRNNLDIVTNIKNHKNETVFIVSKPK